MGLSAVSECPKDHVFVSIDVHARVLHSESRRSQRVLGLWVRCVPRRSFHADDCDDALACTIFAVGALAAMIVAMMCVERLAHGGNSGGLAGPRLALELQGLMMCGSANVGAKRGNPPSVNSFQLGVLSKAFIGNRTGEEGGVSFVRAVVVGLFASRRRSTQKSLHHDSDLSRCGGSFGFSESFARV